MEFSLAADMTKAQPDFDGMLKAVDGALGAAADLAVSVKALVRDASGLVLVLKDARSDWHDLPGGHVHEGEGFADALVREVREETGLELDPTTVCRHDPPEQHVLGDRPTTVVFFTARALPGDVELSDEHESYVWARPFDLGQYNLGVFLDPAKRLAPQAAVRAANAGHAFFGNQWTQFAKHPKQDPPGGPRGRIKHAVLVIGGQRYRGPSHFQAMMKWAEKNPDAKLPKHDAEGFETESGHFLDREQAAEYALANPGNLKDSQSQRWTEDTGSLESESLELKAISGRLYTTDKVMAAAPIVLPAEDQSHDATVRSVAKRRWQAALDNWLADLEADLHRAFLGAQPMDYDGVVVLMMKERQEDFDDLVGRTAASTYTTALHMLSPAPPAQPGSSLPPDVVSEPERDGPAERFADLRAAKLAKLPAAVEEKLRASVARSLANGEDSRALARRVDEGLRELRDGRMARAADTEAQAAYGAAQSEALRLAGFTHKRWVTVGDERVRDSHYLCESQGAIPVDQPFQNGLRYPGDPDGDASEVVNCRCRLVGVTR